MTRTTVGASWNFADVFEAIASRIPGHTAQLIGDRVVTWAEFDARADGVAATVLAMGATEQDKVAVYLYNAPEYLETVFAACKAGLVPVNTNYRYVADELVHLWNDADAVAVVFHGSFTGRIESIRDRVPKVRVWLWVDDDTGPRPPWAIDYEQVATSVGGRPTVAPWGRSGDQLFLLYTGGTTGLPKGVMWRQHDLFRALDRSNKRRMGPHQDVQAVADRADPGGRLPHRSLPAVPLMHGTGLFNSLSNLVAGGTIILLEGRTLSPVAVLDAVQHHRVSSLAIAGDAFARPIVDELDAQPTRWDISSLRVVISAGVMWSAETKTRLLAHNNRLILVDTLGSSEAIGIASHTMRSGGPAPTGGATANFTLGDDARVLTNEGRNVAPGTGEVGRLALRGLVPLGYYKDPTKSATLFQEIDGDRYAIPGDWAEVLADGTIHLLGRGSQCINTGGEKVFPEEVEEAIKRHSAVCDVAVVGVPDDRLGHAVTALVEPAAGHVIDSDDIIRYVKAQLAGYKAPQRVIQIESIGRGANGKVDYVALTARAVRTMAEQDPSLDV